MGTKGIIRCALGEVQVLAVDSIGVRRREMQQGTKIGFSWALAGLKSLLPRNFGISAVIAPNTPQTSDNMALREKIHSAAGEPTHHRSGKNSSSMLPCS